MSVSVGSVLNSLNQIGETSSNWIEQGVIKNLAKPVENLNSLTSGELKILKEGKIPKDLNGLTAHAKNIFGQIASVIVPFVRNPSDKAIDQIKENQFENASDTEKSFSKLLDSSEKKLTSDLMKGIDRNDILPGLTIQEVYLTGGLTAYVSRKKIEEWSKLEAIKKHVEEVYKNDTNYQTYKESLKTLESLLEKNKGVENFKVIKDQNGIEKVSNKNNFDFQTKVDEFSRGSKLPSEISEVLNQKGIAQTKIAETIGNKTNLSEHLQNWGGWAFLGSELLGGFLKSPGIELIRNGHNLAGKSLLIGSAVAEAVPQMVMAGSVRHAANTKNLPAISRPFHSASKLITSVSILPEFLKVAYTSRLVDLQTGKAKENFLDKIIKSFLRWSEAISSFGLNIFFFFNHFSNALEILKNKEAYIGPESRKCFGIEFKGLRRFSNLSFQTFAAFGTLMAAFSVLEQMWFQKKEERQMTTLKKKVKPKLEKVNQIMNGKLAKFKEKYSGEIEKIKSYLQKAKEKAKNPEDLKQLILQMPADLKNSYVGIMRELMKFKALREVLISKLIGPEVAMEIKKMKREQKNASAIAQAASLPFFLIMCFQGTFGIVDSILHGMINGKKNLIQSVLGIVNNWKMSAASIGAKGFETPKPNMFHTASAWSRGVFEVAKVGLATTIFGTRVLSLLKSIFPEFVDNNQFLSGASKLVHEMMGDNEHLLMDLLFL